MEDAMHQKQAFTWNAWECTTTSAGTSGTEVVHPHDYWLSCTESNLDEVGQLTNSQKKISGRVCKCSEESFKTTNGMNITDDRY